MNKCRTITFLVAMGILLPALSQAQSGLTGEVKDLQGVLDTLYKQLLPQCADLIDVGRGLAGFGALWYIAVRVWGHISRAESIDFYPLLRPFAIGFCILLFPMVIDLIKEVMEPTVEGTAKLVNNTDAAVAALLQQKQDAIKNTNSYKWFIGASGNGDEALWELYSGDADSGALSGISNAFRFAMARASYNFRNAIKEWLSEILQLLYQAAALCINTMRTFNMLILAILGPLVFGLSVFDGLQHTLGQWLARYLNIYLWLPIANLFGFLLGNIQEQMLQMDLAQLQARGDTYFNATDTGYLIFLIIATVGYCCIPSMANHIIHAGGSDGLTARITRAGTGSGQMASKINQYVKEVQGH